MNLELSNLQKFNILKECLYDLLDESVISEFTYGKLLGSFAVCKGIAFSTFREDDLIRGDE